MRKIGISSGMLYTMGFGSIGMSIVSWAASLKLEPGANIARADRWGIFVGQWAPTFFALGAAMRLEEIWGPDVVGEGFDKMKERSREAAPTPTHAR